jgi:voltage-gated potassium channel
MHPVRAFLKTFFLIDVLRDRKSLPLFIYAGIVLLIGSLFYHWAEGWSWLDALYFSVVTLGTVGFGDLTPTTPLSKLFTIFYILNGIGVLVAFVNQIVLVRQSVGAEKLKELKERREGTEKNVS